MGLPVKFPLFRAALLNSELRIRMKTYTAKPQDIRRQWHLIDADGKTLGRLSTEIARRLRGKHKPEFTPHMDTGDYIVVVNAEKVHVTGNKLADKMYHRHTGYIGNLKSTNLEKLLASHPERVIQQVEIEAPRLPPDPTAPAETRLDLQQCVHQRAWVAPAPVRGERRHRVQVIRLARRPAHGTGPVQARAAAHLPELG